MIQGLEVSNDWRLGQALELGGAFFGVSFFKGYRI
jgi:hypothetical protein